MMVKILLFIVTLFAIIFLEIVAATFIRYDQSGYNTLKEYWEKEVKKQWHLK